MGSFTCSDCGADLEAHEVPTHPAVCPLVDVEKLAAEREAEATIRVPDLIGEVAGFRAFKVVDEDREAVRLMSVTAHSFYTRGHSDVNPIWPTSRWYEAMCPHGHAHALVPVLPCSCGIYAAKSWEQLEDLAYGVYDEDDLRVLGQVGFAGRVIEGSQGWRAQKARIVKLYVPYESWKVGERLGRAYNVPVEPAQWADGKLRPLSVLLAAKTKEA